MRYYETDCRDCGLPCIGTACPYYVMERFRCDFCNEEDVKLYKYNEWEICENCLLKEYEVVEGSEF